MLRTPASLSNYPGSTWAGLPAAASAQGQIFRVTDFGAAGVGLLVISDGARWAPLGPQVLARSAVAASVTGTTNETVLATVTVPAGAMGLNGGLLTSAEFSFTNSANNKTVFTKLDGAITRSAVRSASSSQALIGNVRNRNQANAQLAYQVIDSANSQSILAVDTTVAKNITFSAQLALGTETVTLEGYEVWLLP